MMRLSVWHSLIFYYHSMPEFQENSLFLSKQLITCIGNKRSLLGFLNIALNHVRQRLAKPKLAVGDFFSGSGVVSRYMKAYADRLVVNDLELYAEMSNRCYLANREEVPLAELNTVLAQLLPVVKKDDAGGFISELYAPADDHDIKPGERVFYTRRNALYLDAACRAISQAPADLRPFLTGPLLSEASVHANTSGVFKGFHKNEHGVGCFGGRRGDALDRIMGEITLQLPIWSRFSCRTEVCREDARQLAGRIEPLDLIYLDPPYNQHPYGSNYFMLNLVADYRRPSGISRVSGIPDDWNRSAYNSRTTASAELFSLIDACQASHVLISYNSEGFVPYDAFLSFMQSRGKLTVWETSYNTFRGSRNLRKRSSKVQEYLFLLEKK